VDREAILRHLNLNPAETSTQALLLICERYGLDPLLKHMVLIQGRPYVTRDGYLAIAHRSGVLDGIEVLEESDGDGHWSAKVAVHRKDMARPFTYVGRYPHNGSNKGYGPEMAVKCAEVAALRRAFNVTGVGAADERWDEHVEPVPEIDWVGLGWADADEHAGALEANRAVARRLPSPHYENVKEWVKDEAGSPPYTRQFLDDWSAMMETLSADSHEPREIVATADVTLLEDDPGRPFQ
jgi:hypothetical protein